MTLMMLSAGTATGQDVIITNPKTKTVKTTAKPATRQKPTQEIQPIKSNLPSMQTFTANGVSFNMILVEGKGNPYYIGETEVTQELWQSVMGNNPSEFKGNYHPVENVSWDDCKAFIRKLNTLTGKSFRLPKEVEWEYAAKGGNQSRGYTYSGSNTLDEVGWSWENAGDSNLSGEWDLDRIKANNGRTHDVKQKKANELGIYDMSGNVWEWCEDKQKSYRVHRGGCWCLSSNFCRLTERRLRSSNMSFNDLGLRLAM